MSGRPANRACTTAVRDENALSWSPPSTNSAKISEIDTRCGGTCTFLRRRSPSAVRSARRCIEACGRCTFYDRSIVVTKPAEEMSGEILVAECAMDRTCRWSKT